jgi:transposase-like protein
MAKGKMDLSTFVGKLLEEQDGDVLREGIRVLSQALMESEVAGLIGADRYERTTDRQTFRNGYRLRTGHPVGIELDSEAAGGSYFPSLLEPRRRAEQALLAVVQEAYVHGVSTRKVDNLLRALGLDGMSKSEVSRVCAELDAAVEAFRSRGLEGEHPYVWIDATCHKVRQDGRVQSMATVVAIGVAATGERQILGVDAGSVRRPRFLTAFLRSLVKRGCGRAAVVSDAHEGLGAIATVLSGRRGSGVAHFMRNVLATIPLQCAEPWRRSSGRSSRSPTRRRRSGAAAQGRGRAPRAVPQAATLLEQAAEDVLAYLHFPPPIGGNCTRRIRSNA